MLYIFHKKCKVHTPDVNTTAAEKMLFISWIKRHCFSFAIFIALLHSACSQRKHPISSSVLSTELCCLKTNFIQRKQKHASYAVTDFKMNISFALHFCLRFTRGTSLLAQGDRGMYKIFGWSSLMDIVIFVLNAISHVSFKKLHELHMVCITFFSRHFSPMKITRRY